MTDNSELKTIFSSIGTGLANELVVEFQALSDVSANLLTKVVLLKAIGQLGGSALAISTLTADTALAAYATEIEAALNKSDTQLVTLILTLLSGASTSSAASGVSASSGSSASNSSASSSSGSSSSTSSAAAAAASSLSASPSTAAVSS